MICEFAVSSPQYVVAVVTIAMMLGAVAAFSIHAGVGLICRFCRRSDGRCVQCGYRLIGLPVQRCPECGEGFHQTDRPD